jgi:hypothetical protein
MIAMLPKIEIMPEYLDEQIKQQNPIYGGWDRSIPTQK